MASKSGIRLFLFTQFYPFIGKDSVFLDNELKTTASHFDEICVFPSPRAAGDQVKVPENVTTCRRDATDKPTVFQKILLMLSNLPFIIYLLYLEKHNTSSFRVWRKYFRSNVTIILDALYRAQWLEQNFEQFGKSTDRFYSYWMNNDALTLAILKYRMKIKHMIFRVHGFDLFEQFRPDQYIPFRYFNMSQVDKVFTVSMAGFNHLTGLGYFVNKIENSYLGVYDRGTNPFDKHQFTLVSCSSINVRKRPYVIPEVLAKIDFPLKWIHLGGKGNWGTPEDLKALTVDLPKHIEVEIRGYISNSEIIELYRNTPISLFIHLSMNEGGTSIATQEATSFGIPVLATAVGGVPETVTPDTGILIEGEPEIEDLVNRIKTFREGPMNTAEHRKKVKSFWKERFDATYRYEEFVAKLLGDA